VSLLELLRAQRDARVVQVAADGSERVITRADLAVRASRALGALRAAGGDLGSKVLLLVARGEDFLDTFWGALAGGMIPVPVQLPAGTSARSGDVDRIIAVWRKLGEPIVVIEPLFRDALEALARENGLTSRAVLTPPFAGEPDARWHEPALDDLAFLQFSSGSTGAPKGVELTHRNVLANIEQVTSVTKLSADDTVVSWMPYTHDMGLVGTHLMTLFVGATQVKIDPLDFVANPALWFECAHRHRATILATANFALGLALKRIDDDTLERWDLSRIRLIGNGGEPVSPRLCRAFFERFAVTGLAPNTMVPMYGLAEATLGVAIPERLQTRVLSRAALEEGRVEVCDAFDDPSKQLELTDCGPPLPGVEVRIVGGEIGDVEVRGPNVSRGYFGEPPYGEWLRTGDLGALIDGRLVITGRAKDVVVANGRKLYAHDIEAIAESVPGVRAGKACACGFFDAAAGAERAILFVATATADDAILEEVDRKLRAVLGLEVERVVRVEGDQFPKTTSGKLQRYKMRDAFLKGTMRSARAKERDLAIVSMACRFPDASSPEAFWELLAKGHDAIREIPRDRFDATKVRTPSRWGGFLDDVAAFDAEFFGIPAEEAAAMDPQHRLLLEVSYEALERGGYAGHRREGLRAGVFVGAGGSEYGDRITARVEDGGEIHPTAAVGNLRNMIASRVAHQLDLRGPALVVDTACSSALVALHLARESLNRGECDVALVGGVSLSLTAAPYVLLGRAGALSPRGRCHAFDESADGFVPGEGAGVILVKRLADAERDGDTILAIVRGTAINNDGRSIGPMAPSVDGQEAVLRDAWRDAELDPATASYVEAHGTGTAIGDPIEARSLTRVLGNRRAEPLLVGSVKTNIGHLLSGAAIASIIKVVLSMQHRALPPSLHCESPRRDLGPLELVTELRAWEGTRRAGVDAFGFGGTNAHAILDAAEFPQPVAQARAFDILMLSAPTAAALEARVRSVESLENPHELCAEAAEREEHPHRWAAITPTRSSRDVFRGVARRSRAPKIAFVFAGQGAQYRGQGHGLFNSDVAFRERFTAAAKVVRELGGPDVLEACYAGEDATLRETRVAQPLLVSFELALARLLMDRGVRPSAVVGHSVGELAAAVIAGALDEREALRIATVRGELMDGLRERGTMAAIFAPLDVVAAEVEAYPMEASVAAINAPNQIVIAGTDAAVDAIVTALEQNGFAAQRLSVSHAFHSPLIAPVRGELARAIGPGRRRASLRFQSTVTGEPIEELDASYWVDHAERPVLFARAIERLRDEGYDAFVEIGPGATLAGSLRILLDGHDALSTSVLRKGDDDQHALSAALAQLWVRGARIERTDRATTRRLPPHPFARTRHWIDAERTTARVERPLLRRRTALTLERASYEAEFDHRDPLVRDHVVLGVNLLPGSACLELALEAASDALGRAPGALVGTTLQKPLDVAEGEKRTLTILIERGDELRWSIRDRDVVLGEGVVDAGSPAKERIDLAAIRARCPRPLAPEELYRALQAHGMLHGPTYQRIEALAIGDKEVLATLQPGASATGYSFDPTLGDAALQTTGALLLDRNALFIPFAIERLTLHAPVTSTCVAHLILRSADPEVVRCDVTIATPDGDVLARLTGVSLRRARALSVVDRWMHVVGRKPAEPAGTPPSRVAIVGTLPGLRERLEKQGIQVGDAEFTIDVRGKFSGIPRPGLVVTHGDDPDALAWHTFARGVGEERGDVRALHVKSGDVVEAIVEELGGRERAVLRDGARYVPALERVETDDRSPYRRSGHYLITGGGSGLGLAIARDLVARFDARITILGRSERRDLPGSYRRVDITDAAAVAAVVAELGPIDGVFHAAGVLQSGLAEQTSFDAVMAPKARGAEALVAALGEQRPSFLALFSSVSAVLPELAGGVSAYAAANAWLDAYAAQLRARGVPAISIAWGPWGETGMGATDEHRAIVERTGMRPIATADGVRACERAIGAGRASIAVVARANKARSAPLPAQLPQPKLEGDLETIVRTLVARATRVRPEDIAADESLLSLGLESLAAVEIVKTIENHLGRRVPTTLFFEHPTIRRAVAALERLEAPATTKRAKQTATELALSPTQRALVIGEELDPAVAPYSYLHVTLKDAIDRAALTRAIDAAIERHPSLRTVIVGRERQRVVKTAPARLEEVVDDLEFRSRPFDRAAPPLFRFGVRDRTLMFVGHHALADAWSLALLARDVVATYLGRALPPIGSTPADLLAATPAARDEDVAFFRARLASPPPSFLPEPEGPVRVHEVVLDRALTARLRARAAELSVSMFALLLAAHVRFARKLGAPEEVILPVAHARREANVPDAELLVGGFADTLPVRLRDHDDLATLARSAQDALGETLRHGSLSSLDVARVIERRPSMSLSYASFPLEEASGAIVDAGGSTAGPNTVLGAAVWEFGGSLRFAWSARVPDVEALAAQHRAVLEELATDSAPEQVHLRFLARAKQTPDAPAIDGWTYAEVERATRAIARTVRAHEVVGLRMNPSAEAAIAIIGVLRGGGAWLPLDPAWPEARRAQSCELAGASRVLDEDDVRTLMRRDDGSVFVDVATPSDALAYVMFTSGSTGVPKKVEITRGAVARFIDATLSWFDFGSSDRFVQTASLAFDSSVRQIFSPLCAGATLLPLPRDLLHAPDELATWLVEKRGTVWTSVPSLFGRVLAAVEQTSSELPLRWILLGGEALNAGLVRRYFDRFGARARFANVYGPTETTVAVTCQVVDARPADDVAQIPIGRSIGTAEVRVMRPDGSACDVGEIGEIRIRGPVVARGLGPEYRTGDLGRLRDDGAIEFCGRADRQVKLRGFRVELGEIESAIEAEPHVARAVVEFSGERLRAHVEGTVDVGALREALAKKLPPFMIPHEITVTGELPRMTSGKIDRAALAGDPRLETIRAAFSELLRTDVSVDDDFFTSGGDSLLALDLFTRLRAAGLAVPRAAEIFRHRTPRALARLIPEATSRLASVTEAPLASSQVGFWLMREPANWSATIELRGPLDIDRLRRALDVVVARHPMLRTGFFSTPDGPRQRVVDCKVTLELASSEVRFALDGPPLVRFTLLSRGPDRHELIVTAHHIIGDAWSGRLFARELFAAYDGAPLRPLPQTTFLDLASAPREARPEALAHWDRVFARPYEPPRLRTRNAEGVVSGSAQFASEELFRAASARGVTPFAALATAWARRVAAIAGQNDLVFALATSGRDLPVAGVESIFGPFAHGLPVRVMVDESFDATLANVDVAVRDALAADAPLEAIAARVPRLPGSFAPVAAQLFFTYVDADALPRIESRELEVEVARSAAELPPGPTDLNLAIVHQSGTLTLRLDAPAAVADEETLAAHARALVDDLEAWLSPRVSMIHSTAELGCVDAALISYLPSPRHLAELAGLELPREQVRALLFPDGRCRRADRVVTSLGATSTFLIPRFADELAAPGLEEEVRRAAGEARGCGARMVSLAGMIPSHLAYGARLGDGFTTGHATTLVAVVKTIESVERAGGSFAWLGVGSIGQGSLELALAVLPHPRAILLCDLPSTHERLHALAERIRSEGYRGSIRVASPEALYDDSFDVIVAATSTPDALDIDRVASGTVVLDDSFPPAFDVRRARARMASKRDLLASGAGLLDCGRVERTVALPELGAELSARVLRALSQTGLPGCQLESLLLARDLSLPPTIGLVDPRAARAYWDAATKLGLRASPLRLGDEPVDPTLVAAE